MKPDWERMVEDARQANNGFADAEMTARHAYLKGLEAAKGIVPDRLGDTRPEHMFSRHWIESFILGDIQSAISEASK